MYTTRNFKTKKALKEALAAGQEVDIFQPGGIFPGVKNGKVTLEGPHYPEAHKWYAEAQVKDGLVVPGTVR